MHTKLNVGCGDHYASGWFNIDIASNNKVRPDAVASLLDLPEDLRGFRQVYLGHVLEHVTKEDAVRGCRDLWGRCESGARVAVVGPDCVRSQELFDQGRISKGTLDGARFGADRWGGDVHLWECDESQLVDILNTSGLQEVRPVDIGSRDLNDFPVVARVRWQCAVTGVVA